MTSRIGTPGVSQRGPLHKEDDEVYSQSLEASRSGGQPKKPRSDGRGDDTRTNMSHRDTRANQASRQFEMASPCSSPSALRERITPAEEPHSVRGHEQRVIRLAQESDGGGGHDQEIQDAGIAACERRPELRTCGEANGCIMHGSDFGSCEMHHCTDG